MLEEHRVPVPQRHLGHRDDLALDLAGGAGETELRHVPQAGRLGPAGVGDEILLIKRRTAGGAARSLRFVLGLAPLALDPIHPGPAAQAEDRPRATWIRCHAAHRITSRTYTTAASCCINSGRGADSGRAAWRTSRAADSTGSNECLPGKSGRLR